MFDKDQIVLVNDVDEWSQENKPSIDKKFSDIFRYAMGNGEGWEGIAKEDPSKFALALSLAIDWSDAESYLEWREEEYG